MFVECNCSDNAIELVYIVKCIVLIFALHHVYQKIVQSEFIELDKLMYEEVTLPVLHTLL